MPHTPFTIIASNCLGEKIYRTLNVPFTTPFIGTLCYAPCYLEIISDLENHLKEEMNFCEKSKYALANAKRIMNNRFYPIGTVNGSEIHFLHYQSQQDCLEKWINRTSKVNYDNLFFVFTDRDLCSEQLISKFDRLPYERKVCFTAKGYPDFASCVQLTEYEQESSVGDLYENFAIATKYFDFHAWLEGGSGKRKVPKQSVKAE